MPALASPIAPVARRAFSAMGTDVLLLVDRAPTADVLAALRAAELELRRLAARMTRFDATSELRLLEQRRSMRCSPGLVDVITLALDARTRSGGRFDPTVLPALRAAGYDRTFDAVRAMPRPGQTPAPCGGEVRVDGDLVTLGAGVALDLGGVAKGWIVDAVSTLLAPLGGVLVDAGGDIACTPRTDGTPWSIELAGAGVTLELPHGAVATSGTDRRCWIDPNTGERRHHVIDPTTGAPSTTDLVRVTTVAATCVEAEVAATTLLVAGSADATSAASAFQAAWRAERRDGAILTSPEFTS